MKTDESGKGLNCKTNPGASLKKAGTAGLSLVGEEPSEKTQRAAAGAGETRGPERILQRFQRPLRSRNSPKSEPRPFVIIVPLKSLPIQHAAFEIEY